MMKMRKLDRAAFDDNWDRMLWLFSIPDTILVSLVSVVRTEELKVSEFFLRFRLGPNGGRYRFCESVPQVS